MDIHEVAELVAGPKERLRFRQGTVVAVASDGRLTVTIAGSAVEITGVRALASVCPIVGAGVWLATDGLDLFAIGTMAPTGPAFCSITRTNDGNLETGVWLDLSFASNTRTDPYSMWDSGTPGRITCVVPGVYALSGNVTFYDNATGSRCIRLSVNDATVTADFRPTIGGVNLPVHVDTLYELAAGDYVQLGARQSSGDWLAVVGGDTPNGIRLSACWLRPPV